MLDLNLIRPGQSCYAFPCILLNKPDCGTRLLVDFSKINAQCECQSYPIPSIDDMIDKISSARYLTKLDITKLTGISLSPKILSNKQALLHHILIMSSTGFVTSHSDYEFLVMPFWISGACAIFNKLVSKCLKGLEEFTSSYFDDILVFSSDWERHLFYLEKLW